MSGEKECITENKNINFPSVLIKQIDKNHSSTNTLFCGKMLNIALKKNVKCTK